MTEIGKNLYADIDYDSEDQHSSEEYFNQIIKQEKIAREKYKPLDQLFEPITSSTEFMLARVIYEEKLPSGQPIISNIELILQALRLYVNFSTSDNINLSTDENKYES